jgi:hypothetical protein
VSQSGKVRPVPFVAQPKIQQIFHASRGDGGAGERVDLVSGFGCGIIDRAPHQLDLNPPLIVE